MSYAQFIANEIIPVPSGMTDMINVSDSGVTVSPVLHRGADLDEAKEFMKGGFYATALQCKALRLGELSKAEGKIVDQELGKQIT